MYEVTLYGLAMSKHRTIRGFAEAVGWSERKASDILNGKQELTASDIEMLAEHFNITVPEDFRHIFFNR